MELTEENESFLSILSGSREHGVVRRALAGEIAGHQKQLERRKYGRWDGDTGRSN